MWAGYLLSHFIDQAAGAPTKKSDSIKNEAGFVGAGIRTCLTELCLE